MSRREEMGRRDDSDRYQYARTGKAAVSMPDMETDIYQYVQADDGRPGRPVAPAPVRQEVLGRHGVVCFHRAGHRRGIPDAINPIAGPNRPRLDLVSETPLIEPGLNRFRLGRSGVGGQHGHQQGDRRSDG